jgi:hypothetical protein
VISRVSCVLVAAALANAQIIEFESNGLRYQTLTKNAVTVMFATLPIHIHEYAVIQVAVSNGATGPVVIRPEDFTFERGDGPAIRATPARDVVGELIEKGNRGDVIKLVSTYEMALFGMSRMRPTNGYEARRQQYLAEVSSAKIKAAAAASTVALVSTKLSAGQSTDGAVFFSSEGKPLGAGRVVMRNSAGEFRFNPDESETGKRN